ncbi:MAG TPA: hypothetical protein VLD17_09175 [Gemmatimonadaceae bacterium]|nr:hypothetical protein [Gemmatimonadaceae bacterium]
MLASAGNSGCHGDDDVLQLGAAALWGGGLANLPSATVVLGP